MKNLKLFENINKYLFNDDKFKLVYPKDLNLNKVFLDMDKTGEEQRKIDGVGTFILNKRTDIPYMLYVPEKVESTERLVIEANNCEKEDREAFILQAVDTIKRTNDQMPYPVPVVVPLIPSIHGKSYYQQLSSDSMYEKDKMNVADLVCDVIDDALDKVEEVSGTRLTNKVFMKGYSSSGVFAQRFCLLHPERVDSAVIGGASGSIPALDAEVPYPLGLGNIPDFNVREYKNIKFRYYCGEYELVNMAHNRVDIIDGTPKRVDRPMHDMTYFPRSVSPIVGKLYRDKYGENYFERTINIVNSYIRNGFDINSTVIRGRAHKNLNIDGKEYRGINMDADSIVESAYRKSLVELRNEKYRRKLG